MGGEKGSDDSAIKTFYKTEEGFLGCEVTRNLRKSVRILSLIMLTCLIFTYSFLPTVKYAGIRSEKNYALFPKYTYGFAVSLNNLLKNLSSTIKEAEGYLRSLKGEQFVPPLWMISEIVSGSMGFNFTIQNPFAIKMALEDSTFYPGEPTKLHLIIQQGERVFSKGHYHNGFISVRCWLSLSFNVPLIESGTIKGFRLFNFEKSFGLRRVFYGPMVNYPEEIDESVKKYSPTNFVGRDSVSEIFPPYENSESHIIWGPHESVEYGGWVPFLYDEFLGDPIFGVGIGVAPSVHIKGLLSGSIDGPGVHKTFLTTGSTILKLNMPSLETSRIVEPLPLTIHNIKSVWEASLTFKIFVWAFVINPEYLAWLGSNLPPRAYFVKHIHVGEIDIRIPTQTYVDQSGFTVYIPTFLMDKDPFFLDNMKMLYLAVIIGSLISVPVVRRLRH
jgi:hypothetical protein